jgi:hypothetical protein
MANENDHFHDPFLCEIQSDEIGAVLGWDDDDGIADDDDVDPFEAEEGEFIHDDDLPEDEDDNSWNFSTGPRERDEAYEMTQYLRDCNRAYFGIKDI